MYDPLLKIEKLLFLLDNGVKRTGILNEACRLIKLGDNATLLRMVRTNYQLDDDDMWLRRANARFSRRKINLESGLDATSWVTSLSENMILDKYIVSLFCRIYRSLCLCL